MQQLSGNVSTAVEELPLSEDESLLEYNTKDSQTTYSQERKKNVQDQDEPSQGKSGVIGLFRYASHEDLALLGIGLAFAVFHGSSFPILALVFGQMTNTFVLQATMGFSNDHPRYNATLLSGNYTSSVLDAYNTSDSATWMEKDINKSLTAEEFTEYMSRFALYYVFIGLGVLVAAFMQTVCWELACERQVFRLRHVFFAQVLRQDVAWFDQNQSGDLTTKLSDDMERIREGLGSKFSMVTQYVSTFVAGLMVGAAVNWRLTLLIIGVAPVLIATSGYMAKIAASSAAREQLKYGLAGSIAEEVISSIRTVMAFGGQLREIKRYEHALEQGRWIAMKKYYVIAIGMAIVFFLTYAVYGLAFWYGAQLIAEGLSTPGTIFTVFFSVMAGAFSLGNALPFVNAVSTAVGAASTIFSIVDRVPAIDASSSSGIKLEPFKGHVRFENAQFAYPTRPEVTVLQNFNFELQPGKRVALVGSSGAGKSTVAALLQRFYDPLKGSVLVDDVDLRDLNLAWLRSQIGVVSQEPILFGTTILENIRYGRDSATYGDIINAATMANAHEFITLLPQGYETLVGDRGAQLSGGQKQRIAIARALIRDPKILILDEATSALDTNCEAVVQKALDKAMEGRTTIIVAHRLSTIRNAHLIYAMQDGAVKEWGCHDTLMKKKGLYYSLVMIQSTQSEQQNSTLENSNEISTPKMIHKVQNGIKNFDSSLKDSKSNSLGSIHNMQMEYSYKYQPKKEVSTWKLIALNAPEWYWLLLGLIGCAMFGSVMPIFAFFYGEIFATFTLKGDALKIAAEFWTLMFIALALGSAFSFWLQTVGMTSAAEKLVLRLRLLAFINILRQSAGWFDLEQQSTGKLTTRLARDAPLVKGASGLRAGMMLSALVTLAAALSIALINGWKLALLLLVAAPLLMIASYQQTMILRRNQIRDANLMNDAGNIASECIHNITTVQSLGKENTFYKQYVKHLEVPFREAKKQALLYAIIFAFSQAIIYMMYGGAFRFGAYLIEIGDMTPTEVYRVFFALAFCAAAVGQTSAYMQDYTKAKNAATLMFELIEQKPDIDEQSTIGSKPIIYGEVTLQDVRFCYPSRPSVSVLRGLNLKVKRNQTLALVGASGCGKSTVVSLLERFYDPLSGRILFDGFDIKTLNLAYLRTQIGLVTQEPILFNCTIRENIAYGTLKNVTDLQIIEACRTANIHSFISGLPKGYDTMVGERGTQLSGGQKQRIAIARALIRNPKILLLDEATSALDTESEKVVQEALDKARRGRTCIVVAHRMSTIRNADCIAVLHQGTIVESGTHEELRSLRGRYYNLIKERK